MADDERQGRDDERPRTGKKPYAARDGGSGAPRRDGTKPYAQRDGERRPYAKRDGDKRPYAKRDGDKKPYPKRDGKSAGQHGAGDRKPYPKREDGRTPRGDGAGREQKHPAPVIPDEVTPQDLNPSARNELKTLSKENAEGVARHLAMVARLIDEDAALAHEHALAASRRAGRIAVVRETVAITAYALGDYALALRELRTYRRISGRDDQIALMVDSERGVGRPDRALEVGRSVDRSALPVAVRVELAIAMSGARLDLDQPERALQELDIPELDPDRAFEWSPALFGARATVLEDLGRTDEAEEWRHRAIVAEEALDEASGLVASEVVFVDEILEELEDEPEGEQIVPGEVEDAPAEEPEDVAEEPEDVPAEVSVQDEVDEILADAGVDAEDGD